MDAIGTSGQHDQIKSRTVFRSDMISRRPLFVLIYARAFFFRTGALRINRRGAAEHTRATVDIFLIDVVENWKITGDNINEEGGEVGMCFARVKTILHRIY